MRKSLRFMFASMLMMLGMTAMAQEVTLDFTSTDWNFPTDYVTETASYTNADGYTIQIAAGNGHKVMNGDYGNALIMGKLNATLTLPAFDFDVEKIVIEGNSSASAKVTQNIFVGETAVSTETTGAKETNTYEIAADYQAAGNVYVLKVTNANNTQISKIKIYKKGQGDTPVVEVEKPVISPNGGEFEESVTVRISVESEDENLTIYYSLNGGEEEEYVAPFTLTETTTVKARVKTLDYKFSDYVTATFTKVAAPEHITVARALEIIEGMENGKTTSEKYVVKGYVKTITEVSTQWGNATFTIVDAADDEQALTIFRAKYLENAAFTSEDQLKQGNLVEVQGQLQKYVKNSVVTPELSYGYLLSIEEGLADNIGTVKAEKVAQQGIFNLQGQRVEKAGKGLYIVGGKKVIF